MIRDQRYNYDSFSVPFIECTVNCRKVRVRRIKYPDYGKSESCRETLPVNDIKSLLL